MSAEAGQRPVEHSTVKSTQSEVDGAAVEVRARCGIMGLALAPLARQRVTVSISEPQNARSRKTRQAIQSSAVELLREGGPSGVTMAEVAARAGCSRRAVYLHFGSRAELFVSLLGFINETEGFDEDRRGVDNAEGPVERLRAAGEFLGRYHTKIAPIVIAVAQERDSDDAAAEMWKSAMDSWRASCRDLLRPLEDEGSLHPRFESLDDSVDMMWGLMSIDVLRALVHDRGWSSEKYGHYIGELFVAMFVAR